MHSWPFDIVSSRQTKTTKQEAVLEEKVNKTVHKK